MSEAELDLDAPNPFLNPGIHLWRVAKAERGVSRSGNDQIKLELSRVDSPMQKAVDYLTLSAGAYDGTKKKLLAFFPQGYKGSLGDLADRLVGLQAWAQTEISEFQGNSSLRPARGTLTNNGYAPYLKDGPHPPGAVMADEEPPF